MKSASSMASPVASNCPLCGQANECASAQGQDAQACWCVNVTFSAALLAQVPENLRNVACICQVCASKQDDLNT